MPAMGDPPNVSRTSGLADALAQVRLRESHHRIKNNLQIIASLLAIQARASNEHQVREALMDAYRRVLAVARVHERLQSAADDETMDAASFLQALCHDLTLSFGRGDEIRLALDAEPAVLPTETIVTLALVVNELVTNAVKHACGDDGGEISVCLRREAPGWRLTVADGGPGLPDGALEQNGREGLGLTQALVHQLRGSIAADSVAQGASVTVRFG